VDRGKRRFKAVWASSTTTRRKGKEKDKKKGEKALVRNPSSKNGGLKKKTKEIRKKLRNNRLVGREGSEKDVQLIRLEIEYELSEVLEWGGHNFDYFGGQFH